MEVAEFLAEHGALPGGGSLAEIIDEFLVSRPGDDVQIHGVEVRPFDERTFTPLQIGVNLLRRAERRLVKRIADDGDLPGDDGLSRPRCFAKAHFENQPATQERREIRRAAQIRFLRGAEGGGDALAQQGRDPGAGVAANALRRETVEVIGERAGHELHRRPGERPAHRLIIPAHVDRNLAHGKAGGEGLGPVVEFDLIAGDPRGLRSLTHPLVALRVGAVGVAARVEVSAAPESIRLGFHRFVHEAAGDGGARSVEPRNHEDAVGRIQQRPVGGSVKRIARGAGPRAVLFVNGQQDELAVHGGLVALQFRAKLVNAGLDQLRVRENLQRHSVAQNGIANRRARKPPDRRGIRACSGGAVGGRAKDEELIRLEEPEQRAFELFQIFRARHRFRRGQGQADDLSGRNIATLRVMFRHIL